MLPGWRTAAAASKTRRACAQAAWASSTSPISAIPRATRSARCTACHERLTGIHAAQDLEVGCTERRALREHQSSDRGSDEREGAPRRKARPAALLTRYTERREG